MKDYIIRIRDGKEFNLDNYRNRLIQIQNTHNDKYAREKAEILLNAIDTAGGKHNIKNDILITLATYED